MVRPTSDIELTPLDQIRQTEADVTRAVAAARQAAEQIVVKAQREAAEMKHQAQESGVREGKARFREMISIAEEEAQGIVAKAKEQANELRRKGQQRMELGVHHAVSFVVSLGEE